MNRLSILPKILRPWSRWVVVRHGTPGTPHLLASHLDVGVINAGDGPHAPTQGLLDIFSIRERPVILEGFTVGLVGDIALAERHGQILGLHQTWAKVILCGPPTLVSDGWQEFGVEVHMILMPFCHDDAFSIFGEYSSSDKNTPVSSSENMPIYTL